MLTFADCVHITANRDSKEIQNNTTLRRISDKEFAVILYATPVVRIFHDGSYIVSTGGWNTVTTKQRINQYSPGRVYTDKKQLYLNNCRWDGSPTKI